VLAKELVKGIGVQVVLQSLYTYPWEGLGPKHQLVVQQVLGLLEFREQEPRHVIYV
jgi:hypothetical protein